jgi:hypothetical protein
MPEYEVELERNRIIVERATVYVTANDRVSARALALEAAEADWDAIEVWEDSRKVLFTRTH